MNTLGRRHLVNLLLLAVVLGLVGLVLWEQRAQQAPSVPQLLQIEPAAIQQLRIERTGQAALVLQRLDAERWQLQSPLAIDANGFRIQALLRVSELRSLGSFSVSGAELAVYGLDQPSLRLIINGQLELVFGGQTTLDYRRYVRLGEQIHIVPDTLYYHLIGDWHGFVSQRLLPEQARIEALQLPGLSLQRSAEGWQLEPAGALRSADQIQTLLDAWQHPGVVQVRAYAGGAGETIRIGLAGMPTLEFLLLEDQGEYALARPELGIQYQLSEASAAQLLSLGELVPR
ncbi:MAG: DUF4340 domain-containing protein [Gammaproteobacteria bacterium]|nr:DUF4340 domain-containing protein [Gammaproteobacteria bacterium]